MPRSKPSRTPARSSEKVAYSTTEGRQEFPDLLQKSYGEKSILGFNRYGRFLGALVPPEAVMLLAEEHVDDATRRRIKAFAMRLMDEMGQRPAALEFVDFDDLEEEQDVGKPNGRSDAVRAGAAKILNKPAA